MKSSRDWQEHTFYITGKNDFLFRFFSIEKKQYF
jgi:hypothetical protein